MFCGGAYNIALQSAKGGIIGIVDIDDVLCPTAMHELCELYKKYTDIDYIYTQHVTCNRDMKTIKNGVSSLPVDGKSFADLAVDKKHCFSHWRTFRRSVVSKSTRPLFVTKMKCCVDKNLGMTLEEIGKGGFYNKVLYRYRWYLGNMTSLARGGTNKGIWVKLSKKYQEQRATNNILTYPVIEVKL